MESTKGNANNAGWEDLTVIEWFVSGQLMPRVSRQSLKIFNVRCYKCMLIVIDTNINSVFSDVIQMFIQKYPGYEK